MTEQNHYVEYLDSKFGEVIITADEIGVTAIRFVMTGDVKIQQDRNQHTRNAAKQLSEYFANGRQNFDLTLNAKGTTFQKQVWQQLSKIPFGQTCSYADIAKQIDNPKAVRAVGAANGRNPISIVVPCHRVIGSNGSLTGYAWGTSIKANLLELEKALVKPKVDGAKHAD